MELTLESDAEALWQDTLDLLSAQAVPAAMLAMLQNCTPTSLEDGTLRVETPMRMVAKNVAKNAAVIEACLAQAAFEPIHLDVQFVQGGAVAATAAQRGQTPMPQSQPQPAAAPTGQSAPAESTPLQMGAASSTMSREEVERWNAATGGADAQVHASAEALLANDEWDEAAEAEASARRLAERRQNNPLADQEGTVDSKLTFDRFVQGDENEFAYNAALQVANGNKDGYNPLFIYGKSGLGKTHLLRAIQNYIVANDPSRICVYMDASQFTSKYVDSMREGNGAADTLRRNYEDVDVLIIDDVQGMAGKAGTLDFFFNIFNTLKDAGKQIVIAADRTPAELGMGANGFDERLTSRIASGFPISVQVPSYELKLRLISTFCDRIREDNEREHVGEPMPPIPEELQKLMAERAGANIRVIEGFCHKCLITAAGRARQGNQLLEQDVLSIAKETWPQSRRAMDIEVVQKCVEKAYDISHADLVGKKRNKEIKEPRHVAIYLCHELCNLPLAAIGEKFGGRSHATIHHSLRYVEQAMKEDKVFYDHVVRIRESIAQES